MSVTTLQDKLTSAGAALATYRGADTPTSFGNPAAEFRALLEGSGLYDMSWQSKLVLTGEDRVRWLNGMVTNNVRDLAVGHGVYSFLLTAQGRIVADLVSYNRGDYLLVTSDRAQAPAITEMFDRYIIMDDVEVQTSVTSCRRWDSRGQALRRLCKWPESRLRTLSEGKSSIWFGAMSASRSRAVRTPTWTATRSGSQPNRLTQCGTG